ncbi:acetylcholinesterase-like [Aedes albopictus]|uniref:Carboxylic ester hydrolase n=1 Tax=Aedes albopictus TaxID=7160 RepID=A0ABM1ZC27_AEDAL
MIEFIVGVYRLVIGTIKYFLHNRFIKIFTRSPRPTVEVRQGKLRGISTSLPNGSTYHYFKGIPYAKPPVGDLRFKPPVPLEKFDTALVDCAVDRSEFIQQNMYIPFIIKGSEKQLHLNVYTPQLPELLGWNPNLPVMVFIHGGGYVHGSAWTFLHDPKHLVQEGVVVVVISYRLGPLGFLSFPSMGIAGNAGLKDQVMAFRWVKENINQFGGNPENVTVFGESAGSWSTYLHYLSPNSRKYFKRAICQSGVVCTDSFFQVDPEKKARKLAKLLGYKGCSDDGVYETLMKAPAHLIVKYQHDVADDDEKKLPMNFLFRPVIEQIESEDSIITASPQQILKQTDTIDMPLITGCTNGEGILAYFYMRRKNQIDAFVTEPERLVPCYLRENSSLNLEDVGIQIKRFFFGSKKIRKSNNQHMRDLLSDNTFVTTTMINAELLAKYQPKVQHFHYRFTFHGRFSLFKRLQRTGQFQGACHGDDQFYIFDSPMLPNLPSDSDEVKVRNHFVRLWTNFAKYGHPTPTERDQPAWPVAVRQPCADSKDFNLTYLDINTEVRVEQNPDKQRHDFWRNMIALYKSDLLS